MLILSKFESSQNGDSEMDLAYHYSRQTNIKENYTKFFTDILQG